MKKIKTIWAKTVATATTLVISSVALAGTDECQFECQDPPTAVSEPGTLALFALGIASVILIKKFRK